MGRLPERYKPREVDELTLDEVADALGLDDEAPEPVFVSPKSLLVERVRRAQAGLPPPTATPAVTDPDEAARLRALVGQVRTG
jgi:hypothetical protein